MMAIVPRSVIVDFYHHDIQDFINVFIRILCLISQKYLTKINLVLNSDTFR